MSHVISVLSSDWFKFEIDRCDWSNLVGSLKYEIREYLLMEDKSAFHEVNCRRFTRLLDQATYLLDQVH